MDIWPFTALRVQRRAVRSTPTAHGVTGWRLCRGSRSGRRNATDVIAELMDLKVPPEGPSDHLGCVPCAANSAT